MLGIGRGSAGLDIFGAAGPDGVLALLAILSLACSDVTPRWGEVAAARPPALAG